MGASYGNRDQTGSNEMNPNQYRQAYQLKTWAV